MEYHVVLIANDAPLTWISLFTFAYCDCGPSCRVSSHFLQRYYFYPNLSHCGRICLSTGNVAVTILVGSFILPLCTFRANNSVIPLFRYFQGSFCRCWIQTAHSVYHDSPLKELAPLVSALCVHASNPNSGRSARLKCPLNKQKVL